MADQATPIGGGVAALSMEMPWWQGITRYQWIVLLMTALGLMFDLMDASLLGLAMSPALRDLLGPGATTRDVGIYGGMITTVFLIGWSLGGIVFGVVADYFGRKNALMFSILVYSVFTGLAYYSTSWWDFTVYRFITALGIGGEWGAGTALLAETWPERSRVKGGIILQSASSMGSVIASIANTLVGGYSWRYLFLVGAIPGFLLLGLRYWVKESDRWLKARKPAEKHARSGGFTLRQIFSKERRRDTIVGSLLATIIAFGFWAVGWFLQTMISEMLTQGSAKVSPKTVIEYVSNSRILIAAGSLLTYAVFMMLKTNWRRVGMLHMFFIGSFVTTMMTLYLPTSLNMLMWMLPLMGFFVLGSWVVFPIYLPELFPTNLRGTGAGFCFTVGRALSAIGPSLTGYLVGRTGSWVTAMTIPTFVYLLGPIVLLFARETRGETLK